MDNKRSKKPFLLALSGLVLLVVAAAAFVKPTVQAQTVEQTLPTEQFVK